MAFLYVKAKYLRVGDCKLLEAIKLDDRSDFMYLKPSEQFLCKQIEKFRNPQDFVKRFHQFLKLNSTEYPTYYDVQSKRLKFGDYLWSEEQYIEFSKANRVEIDQLRKDHSGCPICCSAFQPVQPKRAKRPRMDTQAICEVVADLVNGYKYDDIKKERKVSASTIKSIRKRFKAGQLNPKKRAIGITSINRTEQKQVLDLVRRAPFTPMQSIIGELNLRCSSRSLSRFLKRNKLASFIAIDRPQLFRNHLKLRTDFASLVSKLPKSTIDRFVFTDEKTIHNSSTGRIRVIRKRGRGLDRRFMLRRDRQGNKSLNLYGFVTSKGVGSIFVFEGTTSAHYIWNLQNFVLPAIRSIIGDEFILVQDNATVHMADECLKFFHQE